MTLDELCDIIAAAIYDAVVESGAYATRLRPGDTLNQPMCVDGDLNYVDLARAVVYAITTETDIGLPC